MKATEFDEKFAAGEDLTQVLDISQAKRINQAQKRICVNADSADRIHSARHLADRKGG